jgi:hypothetical protein
MACDWVSLFLAKRSERVGFCLPLDLRFFAEVRFVEEEGDQGPQASTVVPLKRQHG